MIGLHYIKSLLIQLPIKVLPFSAGVTDISEQLGDGAFGQASLRLGKMGSNAALGTVTGVVGVTGNVLKSIGGIEDDENDVWGQVDGTSAFMRSMGSGLSNVVSVRKNKDGSDAGAVKTAANSVQALAGLALSPVVGALASVEKVSSNLVARTAILNKARRPSRNLQLSPKLRSLKSAPLIHGLSFEVSSVSDLGSLRLHDADADLAAIFWEKREGFIAKIKKTFGSKNNPGQIKRRTNKALEQSKVHVILVVGPTEKLKLVTQMMDNAKMMLDEFDQHVEDDQNLGEQDPGNPLEYFEAGTPSKTGFSPAGIGNTPTPRSPDRESPSAQPEVSSTDIVEAAISPVSRDVTPTRDRQLSSTSGSSFLRNRQSSDASQLSMMDLSSSSAKELKLYHNFPAWACFETMTDGPALATVPIKTSPLNPRHPGGPKTEFKLVRAGFSVCVVLSATEKFSVSKIIGYSTLSDSDILEHIYAADMLDSSQDFT